jgi:hypothetical protein
MAIMYLFPRDISESQIFRKYNLAYYQYNPSLNYLTLTDLDGDGIVIAPCTVSCGEKSLTPSSRDLFSFSRSVELLGRENTGVERDCFPRSMFFALDLVEVPIRKMLASYSS